jgi:RNA polymerase sigma-70 factor (ECF subfamily)
MWMDRLGPRLIAVSTAICRDRHRAEEIVQEAFVKLWQRPPDAGEAAYSSWMRRVVTNLSINALQRTRRPATLNEESADPAQKSDRRPDTQADVSEQLDLVREAMDRLDVSKRTILILRAYEQLSYEQIAEHLDIPVGTVMSRLNRARAALAQAVEQGRTEEENAPPVLRFRQQGAQGA